MTLEQECFRGDQDYTWKQRLLSRILWKLGEQALPGAPYGEQYFQNLHRRNISVYTLKSAFTTIQSFSSICQNKQAAGQEPP
jgi:hypothetical protein